MHNNILFVSDLFSNQIISSLAVFAHYKYALFVSPS